MKAAQFNSFGEADVIQINDNAPKPSLKVGQVLIEIHAASINAIDWKIRAGFLQKMAPIQFPFTLGGDFAGKVIEADKEVSDFKVGDEVYGQAIVLNGGSGTMAEYAVSNAANTARKPQSTNFEEAGALPLAGVSAIQALEDHIKLQSGQKILVHGGAGGIGHIAIQLAKSLGAYVATTVKAEDGEFVKELGADEVIDYTSQKFEEILKEYDAVFDNVGGETAEKSFQVLKKGGVFVSMLGQPNQELAKKHEVTAIGQGTKTDTDHLNRLTELVDNGKIKVHVDKIFPLEKVQEAFSYQEKNHPQGKVVVKIK
jgi:NADPH:quinone reductase-like Zn-dependent oxidoreductase